MYVGSLYIWTSNLPRDHPQTIKERIRRVILTCILSIAVVYYVSNSSLKLKDETNLWMWTGIRSDAFLISLMFPLILFMILFLGPLYLMFLEDDFSDLHPKNWKKYFYDLKCWRNYFVAPFSEELVFRGCMVPVLLPVFGSSVSIILAPSFFGIAHFHHAFEKYYKEQYPLGTVMISTLFQFSYTTLFGALSSWLFLRTGHLSSAVICHTFCNMMGFPDFSTALQHTRRTEISVFFLCGLILFFLLAYPLTDPALYNNTLYVNAL